MKILLIGEFSGVHNNLKKGLISLGHEVKLAADGDGFKEFPYDFHIAPFKGRFVGKLLNILFVVKNLRKFTGYDVVQFINPSAIPYYYSYFGLVYFLFRFNKKKVYYACGTDPAFLAAKDEFNYFPFDSSASSERPKYKRWHNKYFKSFLKKIDIIIPSMYTYAVGYRDNYKLSYPIPLPGSGRYIDDLVVSRGKLKILFGITRREFKGSSYILDAVEILKNKYGVLIDVKIVEKISFKRYNSFLEQTDVLIDQCKSYDYGMNTILALEKGCVVLSGAEKIAMDYLGFEKVPIINIIPDSKQIFIELEKIIQLNPHEIIRKKQDGLSFVKRNHNLLTVSEKFITLYERLLNINY